MDTPDASCTSTLLLFNVFTTVYINVPLSYNPFPYAPIPYLPDVTDNPPNPIL